MQPEHKGSIFTVSANSMVKQSTLSPAGCVASRTNEVSCGVWKAHAGRVSESADSKSCRVQKTLSVLFLCSFRSSKLTPQPPCIFHDPCWLTSSLSHFLSSSPLTFAVTHTLTHTLTQTEWSTHHHAFFHSQLSYLPKPSKTISLTNSLPNSEWHFIRRRWRGQKEAEVDERK